MNRIVNGILKELGAKTSHKILRAVVADECRRPLSDQS